MKEPHLIALDLDGTLLDEKKLILDHTKNYLMALAKKGHKVVLATGRPYRSFKHYYDQLQLDTPMVCYNGAYVINPKDPSYPLTKFAFPKEVVQSIYSNVGDDIIENIMCETNQDIWLLKEDSELGDFFWHTNMNIIIGDIRRTLTEDPMTMIIKSRKRSRPFDQKLLKAIGKFKGLKLRFWGDSQFSEIFYEHISKGEALKAVAKHYNIPIKRIIAFGDAENDREMLKMAGQSFAMLNGDSGTKKFAKKITEFSNNENGIYHELKKIL